ncbi:MAG: 1-(5-phosphoribosyl)-5-[(5-phosphoribosylamino)methylideneamino]imidazole-4-carboxamide isomerase [Pseudomonadota bacterium]
MLIIPAIDLIAGECVRLFQGRFDRRTKYGDPIAQIAAFARAGAEWAHVVDLDGAKDGTRRQAALIADLAAASPVKIQSGGGVRTRNDVEALFRAGVARAVIGSAAVSRPDEVGTWIRDFGADKICCAFDVRVEDGAGPVVAVNGWKESSRMSIKEALALYPPGALKHALVTDISRDGALTGPNLDLIREIARRRPDLDLQASGGVSSLADLDALRAAGAAAAIVGRALYERSFTLEDALAG